MEQSEEGGERGPQISKGEATIQRADKSGRFSADKADNYKAACETHTTGDTEITGEEYNKLKQVINAHTVSWVRMLKAGTETNDQTRIKNNMIGTDSPISILYELRKDHKLCQDEVKGPPINPVCGAAASYSNRLSHIISTILTQVWKSKEDSGVWLSTEEMIAEMKRVNKLHDDKMGSKSGICRLPESGYRL